MTAMPAGMQNGFQLTTMIWHWLMVQKKADHHITMGKGTHEGIQEHANHAPVIQGSRNKVHPQTNQDGDAQNAAEIEARRKQQERRERKPMLYCRLVAKYPIRSFLITLSVHVLMIIISGILLVSGYDLLPLDFESVPLDINNKPARPRDLAWRLRNTYTDYYDRTPNNGYRTQSYRRANIDLYYDLGSGNAFTKYVLEKIQAVELELTSVAEYNSSYCQLDTRMSACDKPMSIIRFFDGTYSHVNAVFNDPTFSNINAVLYEAYTNNLTAAHFQFFLGKSHVISSTVSYSSITRSILPFGFPIQGYVRDAEGYETVIRRFSADHMKSVLEDIRKSAKEFDFSYFSQLLMMEGVYNQAREDSICAIGSVCFIFILILIHTQSLWIAGFAIFSIITSFLCTNLIYIVLLDFRYIGFFHVLTIFLVLGIGADDIFVFYDVWRNTGYEAYPSLAHRLSDSYRKSVFSMLFTSLTTAVAFFANAISPLLATRSFGVFSGLVVLVNYLSVILYYPTVVIMYHTKFEQFQWPCISFCKTKYKQNCTCCPCAKSDGKTSAESESAKHDHQMGDKVTNTKYAKYKPDVVFIKSEKSFVTGEQKSASVINIVDASENTEGTNAVLDKKNKHDMGIDNERFETREDVANIPMRSHGSKTDTQEYYGVAKKRKQKTRMVRFFRTNYFAFVTHRHACWCILAVMVTVLAFFTYQATRLEPDNEGLKVLKSSHVYSIAEEHAGSSFVESDADVTVVIYIAWGMYENDMSNCHFSTPNCIGDKKWDPTFNPSTPEAQTAVKAMCDKMMSFSAEQAADMKIKTDFTSGQYQISCYISSLSTFLNAETASTGTNWGLTYDYTKAVSFMDARTTYYDSSTFNSSYQDHLEIPISYWLSNKYSYNYTNDFFMFDALIGEETGTYSSVLKTDSTRMYGNDIKYVGIQVNTTMQQKTLGYAEGLPVMDKWEEFVSGEMAAMPAGMQNGFQLTSATWHWLMVQKIFAENAVYGIAIGVSLAFIILIIATRNIITGFLATLSMCSSTVCVIGVITLCGWKLGLLVSLNMCMVVGLTVDYVVHLAEGYTLSLHNDRLSRVRDMLDEMAVSIFFGACTTLGASLFLFIAQLAFSLKFGIFMFSTIGFSLFFSMGLFVTLMGLVGPQNDTGNIVVMGEKLVAWCKSKRAQNNASSSQENPQ